MVANTLELLRGKIIIKEKLLKLHEYLVNNMHTQDASRIELILDEYIQNNHLSNLSKKKIKAMCNPRCLGSLYVKEFSDPYVWWNFLAEIKKEIEQQDTSDEH